MTFDERVQALSYLDLTPRQTSFLVTVALHSGFCLRRQFAVFADVEYGKNVRNFMDRLVARGLARSLTFDVNRGLVYHVHAREIYLAIGQEDNRNRRATSPALVARKLMLLDFVLSQSADEWFATEHDKVALFGSRYQIVPAHMPRRIYVAKDVRTQSAARHFIDKFPIFLAGHPPAPPIVHFACLVTEPNVQSFTRFLWDHRGLLTRLPAWAIDLICPPATVDLRAFTSAFEAFVTGASRPPAIAATGGGDDVRWYFKTRRAVEANDVNSLSVKDIDRFHRTRRHFVGALFESLYADWLSDGDEAIARFVRPHSPQLKTAGRLITHELPFTYSQFGKLPGVA